MFRQTMKTLSTVSTMFIPRLQLLNIVIIINICRKLFRHFQHALKTCSKVKSQQKFCPPQKTHTRIYKRARALQTDSPPYPSTFCESAQESTHPMHSHGVGTFCARQSLTDSPSMGRDTPSINAPQKRL